MAFPMKHYRATDELKPRSHSGWMSYGLPNEALSGCWWIESSTLMDLHFETYLYLHSNNDMYIWNQVNYTKNHCANVGTSSPYHQCLYPKVSCPHQSLPTPIGKYVLRIISLWPDYHLQQRTVLNRHGQGKQCNQAKPCGRGTQLVTPTNNPFLIPVRSPFSFHHFIRRVIIIFTYLWVTIGYPCYRKPKHSSYSNLH
jgi:hypothetical protein